MTSKRKNPSVMFLSIIVLLTLSAVTPSVASAQRNLVDCGSSIEGEFTKKKEMHIYLVRLNKGDQVVAYAIPFGDTLTLALAYYNPVGDMLGTSDRVPVKMATNSGSANLSQRPTISSEVLSASGEYALHLANSQFWASTSGMGNSDDGGVGGYTLYIGCTLRDGTVIKPGDTAQPPAPTPVSGAAAQPITAPSNGFPGLAPIDFSQADPARIPRSGEVEDEIAPTATGPSVFTFEATDGQPINLTFTRLSGNLNLGLVVIDEANKVYFISSLVAASETNSLLTLPAGKYRIGVFKLDLVPPAAPETTVFAITLK